MLTLGLVINPIAGLGGPLGQKGSDHLSAPAAAGEKSRSTERVRRTLSLLKSSGEALRWFAAPGPLGADLLAELGFDHEIPEGLALSGPSTAEDTRRAVAAFEAVGVDLIVFAGGDGTARDVCAVVAGHRPVLGIPAGVKMHSGVFAINPEAAAEIIVELVAAGLVDLRTQEVRDIDEQAFRLGQVRSRYYGDMQVPEVGQFLQRVKDSGREVESLVVAEIADEINERSEPDVLYLLGPGSTTLAVKQALAGEGTLLGVDAVRNNTLVGRDLDEPGILQLLDRFPNAVIILTPIAGQGVLLGRGNQQFSPAVLHRIGREGWMIVATKTKITGLQGQPLLLDTNDPQLDRTLSGYYPVITGYRDSILYPVGRLC